MSCVMTVGDSLNDCSEIDMVSIMLVIFHLMTTLLNDKVASPSHDH